MGHLNGRAGDGCCLSIRGLSCMRWSSSFTLGGRLEFFISAAKLGLRRCGWRVCLVAFVVLCRGEGQFIDVKYGG